MEKYDHVIGVLKCSKEVSKNYRLLKLFEERNLYKYYMFSHNDQNKDCVWYLFSRNEKVDDVEGAINYIVENDEDRIW